MEEFIKWLECLEDTRQQSKVRYSVQEIVLIVFCSTLSRVEDVHPILRNSLYKPQNSCYTIYNTFLLYLL